MDGWTIPYKLKANGATGECDCIFGRCGFTGVDASHLTLANCPTSEDVTWNGTLPKTTPSGQSLSSVDLRFIKNGKTVGCMSPCKKLTTGGIYGFGLSEGRNMNALYMCCPTPNPGASCTPATGCLMPDACRAGPVGSTKYVQTVNTVVPGVYAYSYDDGVGLHVCPAGRVTYTMEFCPAGAPAYP